MTPLQVILNEQNETEHFAWRIHDWFVRHPFGATPEGYDHFKGYFETLMQQYLTDIGE